MRQLQVFHEACCRHAVAVADHEFLVLGRRDDALAELLGAQRPVHQRHRHGLALGAAEGQAVAAGELRRGIGVALELVDHLALGELDAAEGDREAELGRLKLNVGLTDADLAGEGVGAPEAALRGVAKAKQEPLVGTGERLEPLGAAHREHGGLPGEVGGLRVAGPGGMVGLGERGGTEQVGNARHLRLGPGRGAGLRAAAVTVGEQPVRVVEGGAELLATGQVLERRRDPSLRWQPGPLDRHRVAEARQGGAVRAHQRDRLEHVSLRLQDGARGQLGIVQGSLGHDA